MKKLILMIMVLVSVISFASESFDFRNSNWGMTKEEVKASEKMNILYEDDKHIFFEDATVARMKFSISYIFSDNKLISGVYLSKEKYSNSNEYDVDFYKIKNVLDGKYGFVEENSYWSRDLYKGDYLNRGLAISIGDLAREAIWSTDKARVRIVIKGNNYDITLAIVYKTNDENLLNAARLIEEKEINNSF